MSKIHKQIKEEENKKWLEKFWEGTKILGCELIGYYDFKRMVEGIDPVTGEKLTAMQQATAAAMLAAGLIPVFGWVGKGGTAIYKTTKAVNATTTSFDMYKTTKSLQIIKNTEYGIYRLVSANGFSEYLTGKDILGNELTTSQRQASLSLDLVRFFLF
ncbi:pre-toxin TG domain-containing protein [Paraliobacillus sp. JSM ZJ581]|uniref:pre-toxin TG domain-containing protein n=1 Tax=Paraliobacillus sp. JSM ZJ581 TaxID=3342118 RepID=UPI0035A8C309